MGCFIDIDLQKILPSIFTLRPLDEERVLELMNSIKANGLLHPIVVKPVDEAFFRIVLGSHRFEAFRRLDWETIPAQVRVVSDEEGFLMNVTENLLRNNHMNPIAETKGYKLLISHGWTIHEIALKIGKSDSYVCDRLRLLKRLHPEIQRQLEFPRGNSNLTVSHAENLASIDDPGRQLELVRLIEKRKLSVRRLERLTHQKEESIGIMPNVCACVGCPHYMVQQSRIMRSQVVDAGLLGHSFLAVTREEPLNFRNKMVSQY